jgi:hypothetical protein
LTRTIIVTTMLAITSRSTTSESMSRCGRSARPNPALTTADAPGRPVSVRTAAEKLVNTGA